MDEVRSPRLGVRLSAADRLGAAVSTDSPGRRLTINFSVAAAVLAVILGGTYFILHDVGAPLATAPETSPAESTPAEATPAESVPAERAPEVNAQVQEVERLLGDLGFSPGQADGVLDSETEAAIRAYQQAAGLPEDGRATPELLEELKAVAGE